jgi:phasin family protein
LHFCATHHITTIAGRGTIRKTPIAAEEHTMANTFDDVQKYGKDQMEQFSASAAAVARGFQAIASETADYSKRSLESTSAYLEKMLGTKSVESAISLHSEFAKSQFEGFVAQASKVGEIYRDIAKEAFRPVELAVNKGTQAVQQS